MVIMGIDEVLRADVHSVKYIGIGDRVYAISLISLLLHKHKYPIKYGNLTITQELLDSMPPPHREYKHIDLAFLQNEPIVMFESVIEDGRYHRHDGRHRIWRAHELGLKQVPAIWCSREVWGCFIIGEKVVKDRPLGQLDDDTIARWEYVPHSWEASPARHGFNRFEPDFHLEPNFEIPNLATLRNSDKYHPIPAMGIEASKFDKLSPSQRKEFSEFVYGQSMRKNTLFRFG